MAALDHHLINDVFRGPIYGRHDIFTAQSWRRFVRMHDVDLERAIFARTDDEVVGTIAFAQRGDRAWLAVMGVLQSYRKRGYGRTLFGAAVDAVRSSNARHVEFEVLQRNDHARRMYESFGFSVHNELFVWRRPARRGDDRLSYCIRRAPAIRNIAAAQPVCWQRDAIAVARAGRSALIEVPGGYAFVVKRPFGAALVDAGATNESSAHALLEALDASVPHELSFINEPVDSPLASALASSRWRVAERQYQFSSAL